MWRGRGAFAVAGIQDCRMATKMVVSEEEERILHACRGFAKFYDNVIKKRGVGCSCFLGI